MIRGIFILFQTFLIPSQNICFQFDTHFPALTLNDDSIYENICAHGLDFS